MPELTPKKSFSQNFLINPQMQAKVIREVGIMLDRFPERQLVEIGPGQGDLTQHLVDFGRSLTCIELDPEAIRVIQGKDYFEKLNLVQADALRVLENDTNKILPQPFALFSSLPYSVGSRILVELGLNYPDTPFCVIVQKEVASKTKINNKKITFFGLWLNLFWDCKISFDIPAGNFFPAPRVTSSLLVGLTKKSIPAFLESVTQRQAALQIIQKLLHQPNKTLYNNLRTGGYDPVIINQMFESLKLDQKSRLSMDNFEPILCFLTERNK